VLIPSTNGASQYHSNAKGVKQMFAAAVDLRLKQSLNCRFNSSIEYAERPIFNRSLLVRVAKLTVRHLVVPRGHHFALKSFSRRAITVRLSDPA
jgi:hypothetical protein